MKVPRQPTEAADGLRDDVRFLGALLGEALEEQGGAEFFNVVESTRLAARARRGGDGAAETKLEELLTGLESSRAAEDSSFEGRLRDEITVMWQTAEHSGLRRTVADEVEHVLFYMIDVVYLIAPVFEEALSSALASAYGSNVPPRPTPSCGIEKILPGLKDGNRELGWPV